jgi:hypothetical protein
MWARGSLNEFKIIQIQFKPDSIQTGLSQAQKIKIKYDFEGFDERNNFPYINLLRFEVYFEI